jgi:hypothetical protein
MKRIIFYADVIIAVCLSGGFAAIFWILSSTVMAKVFEAEFSAFTTLLFLSLYVLLFFILAVFILFAVGFSIYRANIQHKKRTRSFTVLRPEAAGERKESAFFPISHFAGDLSGFGCFAPGPGMLFTNYESPAPFARERNYAPFTGQKKSFSYGKNPAGNKPHITLVKGGRTSPGDLPKDAHGTPSPEIPAGKDNNIRPFPGGRNNRHKR